MFCGQATTPDTRQPFKLQPQAICRARHLGFAVNCCGLAWLLIIIPYLLALSMEIKANISIKLKTLVGVREGKTKDEENSHLLFILSA